MKKILKLDVDDLLLDLSKPWLARYNFDWNDNLQKAEIVTWDMSQYVRPECGKKIYSYLTNKLYQDVYPIEGALEGVSFLRKHYDVLFVTAFHAGSMKGKFARMNELGFEPDGSNFICCSNKALVKGDFMVDDNPKTISEAGKQGVLYTQPWNLSSTFTPRCNDWVELIRFFKREIYK
jgi:5'(3')-deoxyribonucleotidase